MKTNLQKLWILIVVLFPNLYALAYSDFEIDGIQYEIRSSNSVCAVSAENYSTNDIKIPETVLYNGKQYIVEVIGAGFNGGYYSWGSTYIIGDKKSLFIPKSVLRIEEDGDYGIFNVFENITSINVDEENQIYRSVNGVLYFKDLSVLLCYPKCNTQQNFVIPNGVEEIYESAFNSSMYLKSIVMPNSLRFIRKRSFSHCEFLKVVQWSKKLETIERDAFYSTNITEAILPSTLNELQGYAFDSFKTMNIYCEGSTPAKITPYKGTYQPFNDNTLEYGTLYVPQKAFKAYSTAPYWREFKRIVEYEVPSSNPEENTQDCVVKYLGFSGSIIKNEQITLTLPIPELIDGYTFIIVKSK